jgi:hypothetical protein
MQRPMTTTLDAEHLVSRGTTHLGQPAANAAQVCPNLSVHRELDSMWRTGTGACDKIRQQDSYETHTIMRNNLPARHFSSTNVQLIRQLHALHSDWSGCIGEPILLSALQKVSIAADLAPTRSQNSSNSFTCCARMACQENVSRHSQQKIKNGRVTTAAVSLPRYIYLAISHCKLAGSVSRWSNP